MLIINYYFEYILIKKRKIKKINFTKIKKYKKKINFILIFISLSMVSIKKTT